MLKIYADWCNVDECNFKAGNVNSASQVSAHSAKPIGRKFILPTVYYKINPNQLFEHCAVLNPLDGKLRSNIYFFFFF